MKQWGNSGRKKNKRKKRPPMSEEHKEKLRLAREKALETVEERKTRERKTRKN